MSSVESPETWPIRSGIGRFRPAARPSLASRTSRQRLLRGLAQATCRCASAALSCRRRATSSIDRCGRGDQTIGSSRDIDDDITSRAAVQSCPFASSTIWVCVTIAASRPSPRVMRVCTTMVDAPAMQRDAFGARDVADRNAGEEIGLALDRGGALAGLQVRVRDRAAQTVRIGHQRAAMHHAAAVLELLAHGKLGLEPLGRDADRA